MVLLPVLREGEVRVLDAEEVASSLVSDCVKKSGGGGGGDSQALPLKLSSASGTSWAMNNRVVATSMQYRMKRSNTDSPARPDRCGCWPIKGEPAIIGERSKEDVSSK